MEIYYSSKFKKEYGRLPEKIKILAERRECVFRANPNDVRLKTHQLTGKFEGFSSFSINYQYRVVFEYLQDCNSLVFHSIGTHDIYK